MSNTASVLRSTIERAKAKNPGVGSALERWERTLAAAGKSLGYRLFLVSHVKRFLAWNGWDLDPRSLEDFFVHLADNAVPVEERKACQRSLRLFLKHQRKPIPSILKTKIKGPRQQLTRKDLLTSEEVQSIIDVALKPRDKALIAVLYDTGCRIEELASMRYEDVRPHPDYPAFVVTFRKSKTKVRENVLFDAAPYLRDWLNVHPSKKQGPLWLGQMNGQPFRPFTKDAIRNLLYGLVKKAKDDGRISRDRHIWPHLFRHTRATQLLEMGYMETKLKARLGWTLSSQMMARYVHLALPNRGIAHGISESAGGRPHLTIKSPHRLILKTLGPLKMHESTGVVAESNSGRPDRGELSAPNVVPITLRQEPGLHTESA